jgi:hypothetical protein
VAELVGELTAPPRDPVEHQGTGVRGRAPTNLSGGLEARGHPVGGTGLFQIAECALQLAERFPNPRAQVPSARLGIAHSIGGPGNNVYVTVIERADSKRRPDAVPAPRLAFGRNGGAPVRAGAADLDGARGTLLALTTIHVTGSAAAGQTSVAVVEVDGSRHLARLDPAAAAGLPPEDALAGLRVRLALAEDGTPTFRPDTGPVRVRWADRVREMIGN